MSDLTEVEVKRSGRKRGGILDILTVLILALSIVAAIGFVLVYAMPGILPDSFMPAAQTVPQRYTPRPTLDMAVADTPISVAGIPPTWTPLPTGQPTATPTPRGTATNTPTPSITPTWRPTNTPTRTPTPTSTSTRTPTPGPSPTPSRTRSAFPFTMETPNYTRNFANNAGCNWLGAAGQIFDLDGNPVPGGAYRILITESGITEETLSGGALAYGPSGWEIFINDAPRVATHRIQLFTPNGTPVSEVYEFQTLDSCNHNLVILNFVQNH